MREIDRILEKGVIPEDFLREEVRNDFKVTRERKELWAISLDLLFEFDRVCKKYGFQYFLCGGSVLGAVRHKGFIPWDDDLDAFLFRDDYEKFIQLAHEFDYPYFLQTPETDPGYYYTMAKIRNSNTTMMSEKFKYNKFNQGVWFSVFPLDHWKIEGQDERWARIKELILDNSTYMRMDNPNLDEKDKERVAQYSGRDPLEVNKEIHSIASEFNNQDTGYLALATTTIYPTKCLVYPSSVFSSAIMSDFEEYRFPIPIGYDTYLRTCFGDYMKFPPIEQRGKWHNTIIDLDKSYLNYLCSE